MSTTPVLGLKNSYQADGGFIADTQMDAIGNDLEEIETGLGELFGAGCFTAADYNATAIPGSLALTMSGKWAVAGGAGAKRLVPQAGSATITVAQGITASATNYVFLLRDLTAGAAPETRYSVNTTGTPPANSILVATAVFGVADATSVNNNPNGRVSLNLTGGNPESKASVRAATTGAITLSGTQTIDGVVLNVNDSVLVKNQAGLNANGFYLVQSGAWIRRPDADTSGEVRNSTFAWVQEGVVNAGTLWLLTTPNPIVLGTTNLTFTRVYPTANTILKDGSVAFTGDESMGGHKLTNVGAPSAGGDAVNKTTSDAGDAATLASAHTYADTGDAATLATAEAYTLLHGFLDFIIDREGAPGNAERLFKAKCGRAVTFPANFSGSVGHCGTNPTATATITIKKAGSSVGTASISTGGVFTFTSSGGTAVSFAIGDLLEVVCQATADATLADVSLYLLGAA